MLGSEMLSFIVMAQGSSLVPSLLAMFNRDIEHRAALLQVVEPEIDTPMLTTYGQRYVKLSPREL